MNSKLSPGRKKPTSSPVSAKTMAARSGEAAGTEPGFDVDLAAITRSSARI
jgi:hypothetical protein